MLISHFCADVRWAVSQEGTCQELQIRHRLKETVLKWKTICLENKWATAGMMNRKLSGIWLISGAIKVITIYGQLSFILILCYFPHYCTGRIAFPHLTNKGKAISYNYTCENLRSIENMMIEAAVYENIKRETESRRVI